jgi:hypothetical protein
MQRVKLLVRALCTLLVLIPKPSIGAKEESEACEEVERTPEPAVCLFAPNVSLTLNREKGAIDLLASLKANRNVSGRVKVTLSVTGPANPSQIKLATDSAPAKVEVLLGSGQLLKNVRLATVQTAADNPASGQLTYYVRADVQSGANIIRSPLEIQVRTSP